MFESSINRDKWIHKRPNASMNYSQSLQVDCISSRGKGEICIQKVHKIQPEHSTFNIRTSLKWRGVLGMFLIMFRDKIKGKEIYLSRLCLNRC